MTKKGLFLVFLAFFIVSFSIFFWLYEGSFIIGKAATVQSDFSLDNSYIFISPLKAKANNQELVRTTVFILNNQGLGVQGKTVTLQSTPHLTIQIEQGATDAFGKAVFDISSNQPGEYNLNVMVDGRTLPQMAHLAFY